MNYNYYHDSIETDSYEIMQELHDYLSTTNIPAEIIHNITINLKREIQVGIPDDEMWEGCLEQN